MLALRPYQGRAIEACGAAEQRGIQRPVVVMPTGAGKTVTFAHLINARGGRALVLAHRDELLRQAADKIRMVDPSAQVGIVKADEDQVGAQVVVASVQTLARQPRLDRLLRSFHGDLFRGPLELRTVIVDEVHHYVAGDDGNTFGRVLNGLGSMTPGGPLTVGFTATPERTSGQGLGTTWQEIVFQLGILDGIREGWLVDVKAKQVKLRADFSKLHVRGGDIRDEESEELLLEADAPKHAANAYKQYAAGMKALLFTPTVRVAHVMAEAFRAAGVPAEAIDGTMDLELRRAILGRLHRGETMVVPNAQVLTEGFDEPSVSCIIMARPTRSRPFAIQCIGRGLRPYPGKTHALVLDLVGAATRMDLVTVANLFDIPEEAAERGVFVAKQEEAALAGQKRLHDDTPDGKLVAVDVSLFQQRAFSWIESKSGRFVLSLGAEGNVVLESVGDGLFDVVKVKREKKPGAKWPVDVRTKLYASLDFGYATGAAEDYMRTAGAVALNAKDAAWRRDAPSDKQIAHLVKRGRWRDGMTKGEASDLLTAIFAR